jgi:hypothetical protein
MLYSKATSIVIQASGLALLLVLGAGLPAQAQDFSDEAISKVNPYKDLPGVQEQKSLQPTEEAECTQEIRLRDFRRRDGFYDNETGMVYRCVKDGIVIETSRPPRSTYWNPLNQR